MRLRSLKHLVYDRSGNKLVYIKSYFMSKLMYLIKNICAEKIYKISGQQTFKTVCHIYLNMYFLKILFKR